MTGERAIRITRPVGFDDRWLTFAAGDADGELRVRVGRLEWERLLAEAPDFMDQEDRRDLALLQLETRAASLPSFATGDGRMIVIDEA